tara:strand:+ start:3652 stop:4119 length:468 start_codon:yes stop_codon:yes gene_type:complete
MAKLNLRLTYPILIINSVSGILIYSAHLFNKSDKTFLYFEIIVGSMNMLCVLLNSLKDKYKFSEMNELHSQSYNNWSKFKNDIYVELSVPSLPLREFMNQMKQRYGEQMLIGPKIPNNIILEYEKKFDKEKYKYLPDIIDGYSGLISLDDIETNL